MATQDNNIATADAWRSASQAVRTERAERLRLPSGATILAARPEPLEWILAGRLPQRLLRAAIDGRGSEIAGAEREISREEILELARFATQLVKATVLEPAIGDGPGEISLDEIPIRDRAFIFEWACRAWRSGHGQPPSQPSRAIQTEEDHSIPPNGIERFRQK